jgi:membrane fusion protein, multidrug efflux system
VQHGQNGLFVYIVGDDNKVDVKPVKVSQQGNGKAVVTDGLAAGQKVVVSGQSRLQKGTLIQPKNAGAPPSNPRQIARNPATAVTQENGD